MKLIKIFVLPALLTIFLSAAAQADDAPAPALELPAAIESLPQLGELSNRLSDPQDPQLRAEYYRLFYSIVAQGYFGAVYADTQHPDFYPVNHQVFNSVFPNPDTTYTMTPIDDDGVYKISGFRGTVRMVDFQVGGGSMFPHGVGGLKELGPTMANYDLDRDVHIQKDGSFEVILSRERPPGYRGDWWQLKPKSTNFIVRQVSYDWLKEVDGRFAIERLDRPAIKPRQSAADIAERLKQVSRWADGWTRVSFAWGDVIRQRGQSDHMVVRDISAASGFSTQKYVDGQFDLAADEALILETEIPKHCRYWSFHLSDEMFTSIDWMNRQSNLNGHTAKLDKDGKFRAVISAQDPGVPNWLDNAGYRKGFIYGRWNTCSSYPTPTLKKVKVADVRQYLPADTRVVTAEARDAAISLRRKGAQMRRRW